MCRLFLRLFAALGHKKPRHTLQILCHSFQDILCVRSIKPSVATSPSRKPPPDTPKGTLYQTAHFADGVIQFTLSLCELHPLLHLEHNPINQAALKKISRVLLATITFIGKDTNALRKLSLFYQIGQYYRIDTIGWRGNLASTIAPWSIRVIPRFLNCLFSSRRSLSIILKRVSSAGSDRWCCGLELEDPYPRGEIC